MFDRQRKVSFCSSYEEHQETKTLIHVNQDSPVIVLYLLPLFLDPGSG